MRENQMRLTLTDTNQIHYHVQFDRWDALQADRARWEYEIFAEPIGRTLASGDDLTTVCFDGIPNYSGALESLLSFLAAAIESYPDGECAALFDEIETLAEVCDADDLSMMGDCLSDGT